MTRVSRERRRAIVAKVFTPGLSVRQVLRGVKACGITCSRESIRRDLKALGLGVPGLRRQKPRSAAEEAFARAISHLPPAEREHPGIPGRRFRFDFAWPKQRIAVEIHGGHWTGGRHTQGKGFASDCEKKRLAILQGWRVLEYTADEVRKPPEAAAADVKNLLAQLPHTG